MKNRNYLVLLVIVLLVILIAGYFFYEFIDVPFLHKFWDYIEGNGVFVTLVSVIFGYLAWYLQYRFQKQEEYKARYIEAVFEWFAIMENKIRLDYRRRNNKGDVVDLYEDKFQEGEPARIRAVGKIEIYKGLLAKSRYSDFVDEIYGQYQEFGEKEKDEYGICEKGYISEKEYMDMKRHLKNTLKDIKGKICKDSDQ